MYREAPKLPGLNVEKQKVQVKKQTLPLQIKSLAGAYVPIRLVYTELFDAKEFPRYHALNMSLDIVVFFLRYMRFGIIYSITAIKSGHCSEAIEGIPNMMRLYRYRI